MANTTGKGGQKKGEPSRNKGKRRPRHVQDFQTRATHLLNTLTVKEILDAVQHMQLPADKKLHTKAMLAKHKKVMGLRGRDLAIMMQMAQSFKLDGGERLESLLNRLLPKASAPLIVAQFQNGKADTLQSVSAVDAWIEETVAKGQKPDAPKTV